MLGTVPLKMMSNDGVNEERDAMARNGKRKKKKRYVIMVEEDRGARLGLTLWSQREEERRGWGEDG